MIQGTKVVKKVKRKPGQKSVLYFDKNTEASIIQFLSTQDLKERERIYKTEITPATHKLLESLINVYDFKSPLVNTHELIEDGCCFIYESLHKWNPEHGSKAFSYFNIVAKRFLINSTNNHKKRYSRHVYLDDVDTNNKDTSLNNIGIQNLDSIEENIIVQERLNDRLMISKSVRKYFHQHDDLLILDAIDKLFESIDDLEFINKQSIYIYISEMTKFDKKKITKTISKIRKVYAKLMKGKL